MLAELSGVIESLSSPASLLPRRGRGVNGGEAGWQGFNSGMSHPLWSLRKSIDRQRRQESFQKFGVVADTGQHSLMQSLTGIIHCSVADHASEDSQGPDDLEPDGMRRPPPAPLVDADDLDIQRQGKLQDGGFPAIQAGLEGRTRRMIHYGDPVGTRDGKAQTDAFVKFFCDRRGEHDVQPKGGECIQKAHLTQRENRTRVAHQVKVQNSVESGRAIRLKAATPIRTKAAT